MTRRTDFIAATTYKSQKIKGKVEVSYKIDGVRILFRNNMFVTRNDKVPPGIDLALTELAKARIRLFKDCEVYAGNFFASNSPLQQHSPTRGCINEDMIYPLAFYGTEGDYHFDDRLKITTLDTPDPSVIWAYLEEAVKLGYEGLVLRTADRWYRVKPEATADVYITGWFEQLDVKKNPKGQLGGFDTNYGKVTAFSEEMRQKLWDNPSQYIGQMMTVQYKERYHTGKFRYAVKFLHLRQDKNDESFDTETPLK